MTQDERNQLIAAVRQYQRGGAPEPQAPVGPVPTMDDIRPGMTAEERERIRQHLIHLEAERQR